MKHTANSSSQLHQSNWKMSWVRRGCGLIAICALAHLTYELSFSFQRHAPTTAAPAASQAASQAAVSENSQAAVIEDSLASRFANPRLPGRWEFGTALDESKERPSELPAPFVNEPDSDHKAGSDPSQHSGPVLPSDADVTGSTAIRIDDRLQRDPRSAGLILPEKGAARQGMLRTKQGSRQTSVTPPLAVRDMSADALRAQLREAARPMLSQQMLENAAEQGTRPEMDAAELARSRRLERLKKRSQRQPMHTPADTAGGSASFRSTVSIFGSSSKREQPPDNRGWLSKVQEALINNLALKWEDAEEARLKAGQEDMQHRNPEPVKPSRPGRFSDLFRKAKPSAPAQAIDTCADLLQIPKVAILFLSRGALIHQQMWLDWFAFVNGYVPVHVLQAANCSQELTKQLQQVCGPRQGPDAISQQHLFSVFVHSPPSALDISPSDPFSKRLIKERIETEWGRWSLVEASRLLLRSALTDPLNQRFVLVSESCIPLYPPTTIWQQLLSEDKSRLDACKLDGHEVHQRRWTDLMDFSGLHWWHWRKSSQWFMLNRVHAELAVNDTAISDRFRQHCDGEVIEYGRIRDCFADEHYYPTLLATQGRDVETDCRGWVMNVDWSADEAHPRSYAVREISAARLRLLRMPTDNCGYPAAIKTSADLFVNASTVTVDSCSSEPASFANTLGYQCPLFARKFPADTAEALRKLMGDCRNRLRIVNGPQCSMQMTRRLLELDSSALDL